MEDIPWRYGEQGWTVVENNLLFKFAACQKELGQTRRYPLFIIFFFTKIIISSFNFIFNNLIFQLTLMWDHVCHC
jgi:hypothetical protein